MYEFAEYVPLNEEEILKRVSQEEIYEMALGHKPVVYQKILSPFRKKDRRPGSYFEWYNNKLFYLDFADSVTHRVWVRFIMDFYKISYAECMKQVNSYFKLGLGETSSEVALPKPIIFHDPSEFNPIDKQREITFFKPRVFNTLDREFWSSMFITKAQLVEDKVTGIIWYKFFSKVSNQWVVIRPREITYAFTEFNGRVKIYSPHKQQGAGKWHSNCSESDIGAYDKLPVSGKILIVTKAYKDCRVIRNENITSVWFQNEGCVPNDELIIDLCERFDYIYFFYDNDEPGIRAAIKLCDIFNTFYPGKAFPIHLPTRLLKKEIKDPTDLIIKNKSLKEFKAFLKEKDLYGNTKKSP